MLLQRRTRGDAAMRPGFLRLCAAFVISVALVPAMSAVALADTEADLSVTATWVGDGVPRAAVGETVTYAITLTNLGPEAATGTYLVAMTPDQFNPVSLTCSDASFCASPGGELAPGATVTATVVDVVCCFPKGESRTTSAGAGVVSTTPDSHVDNDTATVVTRIVGPNGFFFPG
jgi:uncharacterized repeat protein (TIGR01451 family)